MDVGQIQQVFLNILNNAAEVLSGLPQQEGVITSGTAYAKRENVVEIEIRDNGPGMDTEILPKIFKPHFTTKKDGHGFGLVICERIIKNHNGQIHAKTSPEGTTFTITLPLKKQEAVTAD
jgi:signal transduction histidine kinase